jgi:hypothetical protein
LGFGVGVVVGVGVRVFVGVIVGVAVLVGFTTAVLVDVGVPVVDEGVGVEVGVLFARAFRWSRKPIP